VKRREILKTLGLTAAFPAVKTIETLRVEPGDTIVLTYPGRLSSESAARIIQMFKECLGGRFRHVPVIVLEEGMGMRVLKHKDGEGKPDVY